MFLNLIRNKFFWLLYSLKGNRIKHHLDEAQLCLKWPSSENSLKTQSTNLTNLFKHAIETVPY
jgi:hypothetical protein